MKTTKNNMCEAIEGLIEDAKKGSRKTKLIRYKNQKEIDFF